MSNQLLSDFLVQQCKIRDQYNRCRPVNLASGHQFFNGSSLPELDSLSDLVKSEEAASGDPEKSALLLKIQGLLGESMTLHKTLTSLIEIQKQFSSFSKADHDSLEFAFHIKQIQEQFSIFSKAHSAHDLIVDANTGWLEEAGVKHEKDTQFQLRVLPFLYSCYVRVKDKLTSVTGDDADTYTELLKSLCKQQQKFSTWLSELPDTAASLMDNSTDILTALNPFNNQHQATPGTALSRAIDGLASHYAQAYNTAYKNSFWRWVKHLFQKSERAQEIRFLSDVSNKPGCTDYLRYQALTAVNNKIADETFGKGSQLKPLLRKLVEDNNIQNDGNYLDNFAPVGAPEGLAAYVRGFSYDNSASSSFYPR